MKNKPKIHTKVSRGFGDTVEKFTKALGIDTCKECENRKEAWNKKFPYNQIK